MKKIVLLIIFLSSILICFVQCKTTKSNNVLDANGTWRQEVLKFPLIFARSLPYKGEEHIRFAEGWGDVTSEEYFSYVFVWILEENPNLTTKKVESDMNTYFTGLMKMGLIINFRFFKKLPQTSVSFTSNSGSNTSFLGSIEMYDAFFKKENILLNATVSVSYCNKIGKHIVFFRLSPKDFRHAIWKKLNDVAIKFDCNLKLKS